MGYFPHLTLGSKCSNDTANKDYNCLLFTGHLVRGRNGDLIACSGSFSASGRKKYQRKGEGEKEKLELWET